MKSLRAHVRELQILENKAAEKAGMRFLMIDEVKLLGKGGEKYARRYIEQLQQDIAPEILEAAKLGKELRKEVSE